MMFTKEDMLKMIAAGKSADELAKDFTSALNAAVKEQEERERVEKEKAAKMAGKRAAADKLVADLAKFIQDFYPDILPADFTAGSGEELIKGMDALEAELKPITELMNKMKKELAQKESKTVKTITAEEDPIAKFLKDMNLR